MIRHPDRRLRKLIKDADQLIEQANWRGRVSTATIRDLGDLASTLTMLHQDISNAQRT